MNNWIKGKGILGLDQLGPPGQVSPSPRASSVITPSAQVLVPTTARRSRPLRRAATGIRPPALFPPLPTCAARCAHPASILIPRRRRKISPGSPFCIAICISPLSASPLTPSLRSTPGAATGEPCAVLRVPVSATPSSALDRLWGVVEAAPPWSASEATASANRSLTSAGLVRSLPGTTDYSTSVARAPASSPTTHRIASTVHGVHFPPSCAIVGRHQR
jgi:hypothetical protein